MMGVGWAVAVDTPDDRVAARTAEHATGSCEVGVFPSRKWQSAQSAGRRGCALVVVVSEAMTVGTLRSRVEKDSPIGLISDGKGC